MLGAIESIKKKCRDMLQPNSIVMFIVLLFSVSPGHSTSPYLIAHAHDSFIYMCVVIGALLRM